MVQKSPEKVAVYGLGLNRSAKGARCGKLKLPHYKQPDDHAPRKLLSVMVFFATF